MKSRFFDRFLLIILSVLNVILVIGQTETNEELLVDYWQNLVDENLRFGQNYTQRKDNSDFFANYSGGERRDYGTFDFIIIGAGTAGSVVAARLSEIQKWKILVLEAGDVDDNILYMPYLFSLTHVSDKNWGYFLTPQAPHACLGRKNNQCSYPRGKVVGGSSCLNAMIWNRGAPADYDTWEKLGNPGWSWNDVLPLYKKIENYESSKIDTKYRGFAGPVNVAYTDPYPEEQFELFRKSCELHGIPYVEDYQAKNQIGVSRMQLNTAGGKRETASSAYIRPNWHRENFNLTLKAYVTKILIDEHTKTARGVEFIQNGVKYTAKASKEVILSAGAVNSPQLLMLSGIGPACELKKHKIHKVQHLPVGKFLKDHPTMPLYYQNNLYLNEQPWRPNIQKFLKGKGPLTNFFDSTGFTLINVRDQSSKTPNIQIIFDSNSKFCRTVPSAANFKPEVEQELYKNFTCGHIGGQIFLLHPRSVGNLTLKSSNPIDFPLINTAMLTDEEDVEEMYLAIRWLNKIMLSMPNNVTIPNLEFCSKDHEFDSRDYWYCYIRYITYPVYHIAGTTKMGPKGDPLAVVDHKLKVYGINRLRIADCGIIPEMISGNNVAPAYLIGEKAAQLIKDEYL